MSLATCVLRFARPARTRAVAVLCGLALAMAGAATVRAQSRPHSLVGHRAPAFALKNFQQKTVRLSQYRGKVVLLNFWASWCAPCLAEMPTFVKWQHEYHGKLQVLGVNMDDKRPKAEAAVKKLKVDYPVLVGSAHIGEKFGGVYGLPESFVIDAHGVVRAQFQGGNHVKQIHAEIEHLLAHSGH